MSIEALKEQLRIARFEGKKVLPIGECNNFSYETGCLGHEIADE